MATVPETPRTNSITLASPSAGPFLVGFRLFGAEDLEVYVNGVVTTDYTVDAVFVDGYADDATITFGSTLTTGTEIQIDGAIAPDREADYVNPDPGLTRKMNIELGRIAAALSELYMKMGRTLRGLTDTPAVEGASTVDLVNLATYAAEAEAARDQVLAVEATIPTYIPGGWQTATAYLFADLVRQNGSTYICLISHTSGVFNTDLSLARWELFAEKGAAGAGSGDVQVVNAGSEYISVAATFRANLGLTIGTHIQAFNQLLGAISGLGPNGIIARLSGSTAAARVLTGTANQITVTNGDGVAGNPTFALVLPSQAEAEAGTEANKPMTAQRTAQAIAFQVKGARVLLASKTASGSATLDFTEFNDAVYRDYEFEIEELKPATDGVTMTVRFSSNGGSSYDSGASDYAIAGIGASNGTPISEGNTANGTIRLSAANAVGNAVGEFGVTGRLRLKFAGDATKQTRARFEGSFENTAGETVVWSSTGRRLVAQDTDAVRFSASSGNMSGVVRMYGIRE